MISHGKMLKLQTRFFSGPKGRNSIAQGKALGSRRHKWSSPERAELPAGRGTPGFALSGLERICAQMTQGFALGWRMTGFQPLGSHTTGS